MNLDDALLAFYRLTERFEGIPPTIREFQSECGFASSSMAAHWMEALELQELIYVPAALRDMDHSMARNRKLSAKGLQRAYLLTERVA